MRRASEDLLAWLFSFACLVYILRSIKQVLLPAGGFWRSPFAIFSAGALSAVACIVTIVVCCVLFLTERCRPKEESHECLPAAGKPAAYRQRRSFLIRRRHAGNSAVSVPQLVSTHPASVKQGSFAGLVWLVPSTLWTRDQLLRQWPPPTDGPAAIACKFHATLMGSETPYEAALLLVPERNNAKAHKSGLVSGAAGGYLLLSLDGVSVDLLRDVLGKRSPWTKRCPIQLQHPARTLLLGEQTVYMFAESGSAKEQWYAALTAAEAPGGLLANTQHLYEDYCRYMASLQLVQSPPMPPVQPPSRHLWQLSQVHRADGQLIQQQHRQEQRQRRQQQRPQPQSVQTESFKPAGKPPLAPKDRQQAAHQAAGHAETSSDSGPRQRGGRNPFGFILSRFGRGGVRNTSSASTLPSTAPLSSAPSHAASFGELNSRTSSRELSQGSLQAGRDSHGDQPGDAQQQEGLRPLQQLLGPGTPAAGATSVGVSSSAPKVVIAADPDYKAAADIFAASTPFSPGGAVEGVAGSLDQAPEADATALANGVRSSVAGGGGDAGGITQPPLPDEYDVKAMVEEGAGGGDEEGRPETHEGVGAHTVTRLTAEGAEYESDRAAANTAAPQQPLRLLDVPAAASGNTGSADRQVPYNEPPSPGGRPPPWQTPASPGGKLAAAAWVGLRGAAGRTAAAQLPPLSPGIRSRAATAFALAGKHDVMPRPGPPLSLSEDARSPGSESGPPRPTSLSLGDWSMPPVAATAGGRKQQQPQLPLDAVARAGAVPTSTVSSASGATAATVAAATVTLGNGKALQPEAPGVVAVEATASSVPHEDKTTKASAGAAAVGAGTATAAAQRGESEDATTLTAAGDRPTYISMAKAEVLASVLTAMPRPAEREEEAPPSSRALPPLPPLDQHPVNALPAVPAATISAANHLSTALPGNVPSSPPSGLASSTSPSFTADFGSTADGGTAPQPSPALAAATIPATVAEAPQATTTAFWQPQAFPMASSLARQPRHGGSMPDLFDFARRMELEHEDADAGTGAGSERAALGLGRDPGFGHVQVLWQGPTRPEQSRLQAQTKHQQNNAAEGDAGTGLHVDAVPSLQQTTAAGEGPARRSLDQHLAAHLAAHHRSHHRPQETAQARTGAHPHIQHRHTHSLPGAELAALLGGQPLGVGGGGNSGSTSGEGRSGTGAGEAGGMPRILSKQDLKRLQREEHERAKQEQQRAKAAARAAEEARKAEERAARERARAEAQQKRQGEEAKARQARERSRSAKQLGSAKSLQDLAAAATARSVSGTIGDGITISPAPVPGSPPTSPAPLHMNPVTPPGSLLRGSDTGKGAPPEPHVPLPAPSAPPPGALVEGLHGLNMLLVRIGFELLRRRGFEAWLHRLIQTKLDNARRPSFLEPITLQRFDLGCTAPQLRDLRAVAGPNNCGPGTATWPQLALQVVWVGNANATIATKVDFDQAERAGPEAPRSSGAPENATPAGASTPRAGTTSHPPAGTPPKKSTAPAATAACGASLSTPAETQWKAAAEAAARRGAGAGGAVGALQPLGSTAVGPAARAQEATSPAPTSARGKGVAGGDKRGDEPGAAAAAAGVTGPAMRVLEEPAKRTGTVAEGGLQGPADFTCREGGMTTRAAARTAVVAAAHPTAVDMHGGASLSRPADAGATDASPGDDGSSCFLAAAAPPDTAFDNATAATAKVASDDPRGPVNPAAGGGGEGGASGSFAKVGSGDAEKGSAEGAGENGGGGSGGGGGGKSWWNYVPIFSLLRKAGQALASNLAGQLSGTPVEVHVQATRFEGTLLLWLAPPPSDRLWLSFAEPPRMDFTVTPVLGNRRLSGGLLVGRLSAWVRSKVTGGLSRAMVYPACVDVRLGKLLLSIDSPEDSVRAFTPPPPLPVGLQAPPPPPMPPPLPGAVAAAALAAQGSQQPQVHQSFRSTPEIRVPEQYPPAVQTGGTGRSSDRHPRVPPTSTNPLHSVPSAPVVGTAGRPSQAASLPPLPPLAQAATGPAMPFGAGGPGAAAASGPHLATAASGLPNSSGGSNLLEAALSHVFRGTSSIFGSSPGELSPLDCLSEVGDDGDREDAEERDGTDDEEGGGGSADEFYYPENLEGSRRESLQSTALHGVGALLPPVGGRQLYGSTEYGPFMGRREGEPPPSPPFYWHEGSGAGRAGVVDASAFWTYGPGMEGLPDGGPWGGETAGFSTGAAQGTGSEAQAALQSLQQPYVGPGQYLAPLQREQDGARRGGRGPLGWVRGAGALVARGMVGAGGMGIRGLGAVGSALGQAVLGPVVNAGDRAAMQHGMHHAQMVQGLPPQTDGVQEVPRQGRA